MNKFHTSLSRRDFMKGLGLASAGIGAVAAVSPVFHDLDEVASADSSVNKRPWWVREVDKPTIEIDWDKMAALAIPTEGCHLPPLLAEFVGWDRVNTAMAQGQTALKEGAQKVGSREAISLLDTAIQEASWPHFLTQAGWREPVTPVLADPAPIPELVGSIMTHETLGVAKWEGTPEENFALLKSAMRFFGAGQIASIELDTNVKKMLYPQDASRMFFNGPIMSYKFEDVDKGYMTDTNYVIPNTARWIVTYTTPMPKEMYRTAPSGVCYAANMSRYRLNHETMACVQQFLKTLGYQGLQSAPFPNGICPSPAVGTLSGLGEMDRINQCVIPEEGAVVGIYKFITDLPLPVSKPIDFGAFRFCHSCRKCADTCPAKAISFEEEPTWEPAGPWSTAGKRAYFKNEPECKLYQHSTGATCQICTGVCVFNVNTKAMIHEVVKSTLSTTGIFNSFLWKADVAFGYGHHDAAEWWDLDLPRYGFDTTMGVRDGGYGK
ncbi:reductive dehalogenase [Dehalococcoides mccartyi]|uniref:Dehalogenase n=1 Tax=Dehalococcoides mccartyi TaxID=61435 RepID=A0A0V8LXC5_9CHLR|nr:reductive dehalogenase [Dehalococcoides mccartyi]KSV16187.1 dehalogenase [Dehalococcoides mccartyi]OBW60920.1 MAG: reductive dehalogenase [Dehalococcoides mccartyi]